MARKIDRLEDDGLPLELPGLPLVDLSRLPSRVTNAGVETGPPQPEIQLPVEESAGQLNHGVAKGDTGKLRRKNRTA